MSETPETTIILELPDDLHWVRLDNQAAANVETDKARHAVREFFRGAVHRGDDVSFYSLRDEADLPHVTVMLPNDRNEELQFNKNAVVAGPNNTNPFSVFGGEIDALGDHMGFTIDRGLCPYPTTVEESLDNPNISEEASEALSPFLATRARSAGRRL